VRDVLGANLTAMQAPTGPHGIAPEEMQKILAAADQRAADAPSYAKANALRLRGLIYLMRYSGLRISDAVRIGPDDIGPDGTLPVLTKKSGTHVFCVLPDFVLAALEKTPLASARHYFWSGNGKHGTEIAAKDWSERLRVDVFEPAGIKGGHSHRFRHYSASRTITR